MFLALRCLSAIAIVPLLLRNKIDRAAVQLAHASALRSTNEIIEQLQAQVKQLQAQTQREREQAKFNMAQAETEKALLSRELCEARLQIVVRDRRDALAVCSSPSPSVH
jgi:hypothetical protein